MMDPELCLHQTVNQAQVTCGREEWAGRGLELSEPALSQGRLPGDRVQN